MKDASTVATAKVVAPKMSSRERIQATSYTRPLMPERKRQASRQR